MHADAHYHRRGCVSLPSSEWDRVVPQRYGRQGEGGGRGLRVQSRTLSSDCHRQFPAVADRVGRSEVGVALTNARRVVEAKSLGVGQVGLR